MDAGGLSGINWNNPQTQNTNNSDGLSGISWDNQNVANTENNYPDNNQSNVNNYQDSNIQNNYNTGRVPASNKEVSFFDDTQQSPQEKTYTANENTGISTGIGVIIGGVTGALASKFLKINPKFGALIGLGIGGFIGNQLEKK